MQVKLRVLRGSSAGKEIRIPGSTFRIGRGDDCHLRPKSDSISRRHCQITIDADENRVLVKDLGSKNGTYINDEKIDGEVELTLGNVLRVGRLEFEVVLEHGLQGAKRPKVNNVKDAAARQKTDSPTETAQDEDITGWLESGVDDSVARRVADPETRQFQLDETDRVALEKAGQEGAEADDDEEEDTEASDSTEGPARPKKQKPGKLPAKALPKAESSKQAAAEMLKKFFNRT